MSCKHKWAGLCEMRNGRFGICLRRIAIVVMAMATYSVSENFHIKINSHKNFLRCFKFSQFHSVDSYNVGECLESS